MLMINFPTDDELAGSLPVSQAFLSSRRLKKEAIPKRLSKGKGFGRGGNLGKTAAQRGKSGFYYVYNQRNGNRSGRCFGNVRGKAIGSFADRHTCARAVDDYIRKMGFIDLPLNFPNEEDLRLRAERMGANLGSTSVPAAAAAAAPTSASASATGGSAAAAAPSSSAASTDSRPVRVVPKMRKKAAGAASLFRGVQWSKSQKKWQVAIR